MTSEPFPVNTWTHENIHLSDYCNQSCPFCFASTEMAKTKKKEMDIKSFRFITKKLKQAGILNIDFLGGEPTLNSQFPKILNYALKNFFIIQMFTNGLFSLKVRKALIKAMPRLVLIFNIGTPGFRFNAKIRQEVMENIRPFTANATVVLSIVSSFMNEKEAIEIIDSVDPSIIRQTMFKLSCLSPTAGGKNPITINDFSRIGHNVCKIISYLEKIGPSKKAVFNSMYRPCMFSDNDREFLKKRGYEYIYETKTCHANLSYGTDCIHINSDLKTFACYPLSTLNMFSLEKKTNYGELKQKYAEIEENLKKKFVLPECRKCLHFGLEEGQCSGPCLGFRINALNVFKQLS